MKSVKVTIFLLAEGSHPSRGAWIEISGRTDIAWCSRQSHPSRGAWIEIKTLHIWFIVVNVAPLTGCVD